MATTRPTPNMGTADRAVRAFVIAPAAIAGAIAAGAGSIGGIVLLVVTGIALATSITGFCALYIPLGIDTRSRKPLPH